MPKRKYYWVLGYSTSGKRALIGPYANEVQANEACDSLDDPEVFEFDTKSQQKATKLVKAIIYDREGDMDEALTKQLHHKGLGQEGTKVRFANPSKALATGDDEDLFHGNPFED